MIEQSSADRRLSGRGIIIREGLADKSVLSRFKILETNHLKSLDEHQMPVAFDPTQIDELAKALKAATKPAWYSALWNDEKAVIIFSDRIIHHRHPPGSA